ncbi:ring-cleaving dioxygenase [Martelella soudanensis]|uniref:ring-cleaving dioxygenase n=1 Tax=unclassified Martelella TaxID=2629616 RepID=UPI0015DF1C9E|nr:MULTISPECIES: ring-cleaving dioxygenase [unclassified Martelella]
MLQQIKGLHHITSMAADAQANNDFFTGTLGLRRVKKTVNFDAPDVYHLYYGDEVGTPGSVLTYFPFPHIAAGRPGTGEVGETLFAVPRGALAFWKERLGAMGVGHIAETEVFGEKRLHFAGPDRDAFALVEVDNDDRAGWLKGDIAEAEAIRGFHGASLRLADSGATAELLGFMGYQKVDSKDDWTRFAIGNGNGADFIDIQTLPSANAARQGAGSVHHIAFAVEDRAAQLDVRKALMDTGYQVTPVIDRNYFWAIYFRTPGGVLFEIATNEPGFDADEDTAHLGEALKLPPQYEQHRAKIEEILTPIDD